MKGWVYVITHGSMPGLVKVGYSMRDPELRAKELEGTGIPGAYKVAYAALYEEPRNVERAMHMALSAFREGKEWFRCEVVVVLRYLRGLETGPVLYEYGSAATDESAGYSSDNAGGTKAAILPCPGCGTWLKMPATLELIFSCPKCKRRYKRTPAGQISKS